MTTQINLLPWRKKRRLVRQQEFIASLIIAAVVAAALVGGGYYVMSLRIDNQNVRNQMLQTEIQTVDRQIARIRDLERQRDALKDRIDVIQTLQASRPEAVHLFDQMVRTLPDGTFFRELRQDGRRIRLMGRAESNARISTLMRRVDNSPWLKDSRLEIIEARQEGTLQLRDFRLEVHQTQPNQAESDSEGAR